MIQLALPVQSVSSPRHSRAAPAALLFQCDFPILIHAQPRILLLYSYLLVGVQLALLFRFPRLIRMLRLLPQGVQKIQLVLVQGPVLPCAIVTP